MNKYCLTFKDNDLEQLYQQAVLKYIRTPILNLIGLIYSIQLICKIIVKNNASFLHFMLAQLAVVILLLILAKLKPRLTILTLMILDHIIAYDQICVNTSLQSAYINGSNCQLITTLIILTIDFRCGIICNITTSFLKIFFAYKSHQLIDINDYLFLSMLVILITYTSYIVNKIARQHYLYNLKDTQWEKFLPVIDKTFFLFEYNDYLNKFESKLTNSTSIKLNEFLRESKCCNKTLEQHLFLRINKQLRASCLFESKFDLIVNFQKSKIKIKIHEYFLTKCTFLMVVEPEDRENDKIIAQQQRFILKFIRKTQQFTKQLLQKKSLQKPQTKSMQFNILIPIINYYEIWCIKNLLIQLLSSYSSILKMQTRILLFLQKLVLNQ
ncbi:hypothetical protein pb186bvf_009706 [Paramecium bursaria]